MACDRVQQLGGHGRVEIARALFDHAQTEVDVTEQAALLRLPERGAALELADASDVVQERGGEQEIETEARVEL